MLFGRVVLGVSLAVSAAACTGDEGDGGEAPGISAQVRDLTVAGHHCPTRGEIAGRDLPDDGSYYLTTFGGSGDTQPMSCGGLADGTSLYIADAWRFGCDARVRVRHPSNGRWCVARVGDVGPNICIEQAAGRAVIDASPRVALHLYGERAVGWRDRLSVIAEQVDASTPLGCGSGATSDDPAPASPTPPPDSSDPAMPSDPATPSDPSTPSDPATPSEPTDPCASAADCLACTARSTCGWCDGRCRTGTASGSDDGVCTDASTWGWLSDQCP